VILHFEARLAPRKQLLNGLRLRGRAQIAHKYGPVEVVLEAVALRLEHIGSLEKTCTSWMSFRPVVQQAIKTSDSIRPPMHMRCS